MADDPKPWEKYVAPPIDSDGPWAKYGPQNEQSKTDPTKFTDGTPIKFNTGVGGMFDAAIPQTSEEGIGALKETAKQAALQLIFGGAGKLAGMGAEGLIAKLGMDSPITQGIMRGIGGATAVQGSNAAANLINGKPPLENAGSLPNMLMTGFGAVAPTVAGLFAKTGMANKATQALNLSDALKAPTGIDTSAITPTALQDTMAPLQRQAIQEAAGQQAISSGKALQSSIVGHQLNQVNLKVQLRDALASQTAEFQTGNQQAQQSSSEMVGSLQNQMAQSKTAAAQTLGSYTQVRNEIEDHLDALEAAVGKKAAQAMPQYQEAQRTLDQLKRTQDEAQAQFGVEQSTLGEGLTTAKQQPVTVDKNALPSTPLVNNLKPAVAQLNDTITGASLLQKQVKLIGDAGVPDAVKAVSPDAQQLMKELGKSQTTSEFTNQLLDPRHLKVALAAMPDSAPAIQNGVFTALISKSVTNGELDPEKISSVWLGNDGQGLQAFRIALGPAADAGEPLIQKIADFAKFASDKNGQMVQKFVQHGGNYIGIVALMGLGRVAKTGEVGPIAAEIGTGLAGIAATAGFNQVAKMFFTNDLFRQGAMQWATGANVGRGSSEALRYFSAAMHAQSNPAQ